MDETMILKVERLKKMYDYARANNLCKNKATFANLVGFAVSNLSRAFSGAPRYLTDSLLTRINNALGSPFSTSWVLYGEGEMLVGGGEVRTAPVAQPTNPSFDTEEFEYLQRRVSELEMMVATMQKLIKKYEDEIDALKGGNVHARAKNA